ncbi:hypothetical protein BGZ46_000216 [Entomortierella lignicola]|nr:hypothetical protein BGZ46_000216 [Entomortierella lignicola]
MISIAQVYGNRVIKQADELSNGNKVFLPPTNLFDVGSGSGQHMYHFSKEYPTVAFQPNEYDTSLFESIEAYMADLDFNNRVRKPTELDATNLVHWYNVLITGRQNISHVNDVDGAYDLVATGIVIGAGHILRTGGHFVAYGAFKKDGKFSTESNKQFDQTLRGRNASWGVWALKRSKGLQKNSPI